MKTNTDHYFTGKNRHKPCEDYAFSGLEPVPYLLVADGCSSSTGSHIGAMLLTLAARAHIREHLAGPNPQTEPGYDAFGNAVIHRAASMADSLALPYTVLDATLLAALLIGDAVCVYVYGDGMVAARRRSDGALRTAEVHFETNAPYYLSYRLDEARDNGYRETLDRPKTVRRSLIFEDDDILSAPFDAPVRFTFPVDEFAMIALASDGVSSLVDTRQTTEGGLSSDDVIAELTAFKNFNGEFVQRRARRAVNGWEKRGGILYDDLSVAAMIIQEPGEESGEATP